jgi:phosphoribosylformylglycinamidine synthase
MKMSFPTRLDVFLFGEGTPRAIYAVPSNKVVQFRLIWNGFPFVELGRIGGNYLTLENIFDLPVPVLTEKWEGR